ncbi:TMEM175 family protein [Mucilaginibacter ginkgonis]|uniref:DUF1211 domain-containing protein n=1 Tax=Mucilaginibacter ginkgonis TaxID=2682091 RepID=A0A6I4HUH3_9SPHI|nr:TMEM175 family protein [Mucilaginibacter ginkgonis]QQL50430.1 DUF1211 domain-containing protein [Mucilaginibacter ginkgonis]
MANHFLEQHDPDRREFQIDRLILFTDAVFAIAITLLIIEIKPPYVPDNSTPADQLNQLHHLVGKFIGFILSFFVIATYWRGHHRIFGFVTNYDEKLIWLNFRFLLTIVLMPFSSAYYSESGAYSVPFYFYHANIILTSIANYMLIKYVFDPKNNVVEHQPSPLLKKMFLTRGFAIPAIFLLGVLLSFLPFSPSWTITISRMCPILIWPVFYFIRRYYSRDIKQHELKNTEERLADEEESRLS